MKDHKAVMFADSCFWHGCRLHGSIPKSNKTFWQNKIDRNKKRDRTVNRAYSQMDMKVIRVWEHDIKPDLLDKKLKWLLDTLGQ